MKDLIKVELYKMQKRNCFLIIIIFNMISFLYGAGILLNWSWVSFSGKFDLIQYIGSIWQLLFLIGLPLIFFMYIGSSILGGEKVDGQILLEVTRVANRRKLVIAKMLAAFILVLFYFAINIIVSIFSYIIFVRRTSNITQELVILDVDNINLLITCLFGFTYIIILTFVAMYVSIKSNAVVATIAGTASYAVMSLRARIPGVCMFVPGYFALTSDANIWWGSIVQQLLWCGVIIFGLFYIIRKEICKIDL